MGMFFGNYDRPGPGVSKDAPPQKAVPRFFAIFHRKFFDLIKLNLLFCIPVAVVAVLVFLLNMVIPYPIVDFIPVILLFPFIGGLTFVTRNYAREEHAFIFSDFMDAVKNNWAALLADGIVCYAVFFILSIAIPYYWQGSSKNIISTVASGVCVVVALLFIFSQFYVPVQIITFKLKFGQILKNSLLFSILGLGRNFLLLLLLGFLVLLLYLGFYLMPLTVILAVAFIIFLLFAYCSFLINFAVYPLIDRVMIKPYQKKEEEEKDDENSSDFSDRI